MNIKDLYQGKELHIVINELIETINVADDILNGGEINPDILHYLSMSLYSLASRAANAAGADHLGDEKHEDFNPFIPPNI